MRCFKHVLVLSLLLSSPAFAQDVPAPEMVVAPDAGTAVTTPDAGTPADAATAPADAATPTPGPSEPEKAPETVEDAAADLDLMIEAAKGGHWGLFLGFLLMLLVWLADKFANLKAKVGSKALPWVAAGLGILSTTGIALANGMPVGEGLIQGFVTGASAVGLWELLFKHFLKAKAAVDPEG